MSFNKKLYNHLPSKIFIFLLYILFLNSSFLFSYLQSAILSICFSLNFSDNLLDIFSIFFAPYFLFLGNIYISLSSNFLIVGIQNIFFNIYFILFNILFDPSINSSTSSANLT